MTSPTARLNGDVLHIVFGHLDNLGRKERGKALVNTAMACKDFYQPALRIIWQKLDDLFPLFTLFSAFMMVQIVGDNREEELHMFNGAILPGEWERFRMHAEFVQALGPSLAYPLLPSTFPNVSRRIAPSALSYLSRLAGGTPLLTNLRRLTWTIPTNQCTALFPLISPSIDALTLVSPPKIFRSGLNGPSDSWQAFIKSTLFLIAFIATHLTKLELCWDEEHSIAEPVAQLRSLRRFTTAKADGNLLRVLASLPLLEELILDTIVISEQDTFTQAEKGFTHLDSFSVKQHPSTSRFYRLFDAPTLRRLRVTFSSADDYRDILGCCTAWAKHFPSLEDLTVYVSLEKLEDPPEVPSPRPYSSIIEPLFDLRSLRAVVLDAPCAQFVLNDADLEAVGRSWPQLERFHAHDVIALEFSRPEPQTDQSETETGLCVGPAALASLASQCPRLLSLQVPRATLDLTVVDALAKFPVLDHRLQSLSVGRMSSDDCSLAALFIDRLFPNLQTWTLGPEGLDDTWDKVKHHVRVCQTVRQQEAQRRASRALVEATGDK